jgi:hypothetical protein
MKVLAQYKFEENAKTAEEVKFSIGLENAEEIASLCGILCVFICSGNPTKTIILTEVIMRAPIDVLEKAFKEMFSDPARNKSVHFAMNILLSIRKARENIVN